MNTVSRFILSLFLALTAAGAMAEISVDPTKVPPFVCDMLDGIEQIPDAAAIPCGPVIRR